MSIIEVTDKTVDQYISREGLTLLFFSSPDCTPCQYLKPMVREAAAESADLFNTLYCDVYQTPQTARRWIVRAVPTLVMLRGGELISQHAGMLAKKQLNEFILEATRP